MAKDASLTGQESNPNEIFRECLCVCVCVSAIQQGSALTRFCYCNLVSRFLKGMNALLVTSAVLIWSQCWWQGHGPLSQGIQHAQHKRQPGPQHHWKGRGVHPSCQGGTTTGPEHIRTLGKKNEKEKKKNSAEVCVVCINPVKPRLLVSCG